MKLLVVMPAYEAAGGLGGGVTKCLSTLCRAMTRLGDEVTVYTTNASGGPEPLDFPVEQPVDMGGVTVYHFPSTFGPKSMFASESLIRRMRKTISQFDAVYIAAWFMWLGIEAARVSRDNKVPAIAGIHGGFTRVSRQKSHLRKRLFWELFIKRAIRKATAVHLTCHAEQTRSSDWLCGRPSLIVPNGTDPDEFQPSPESRWSFRRRHGIPSDAPVLISVTRFDWMKRVDLLMAAIARSPRWHLVLVGDHESGLGPKLKMRARELGIESRVVWTGYLKGEALREALSAADLSALVSETENFGNVVVEAMMCGLPVLISKEVGVYEYIHEGPFVLTADLSEESVVEALRTAENRLPAFRADSGRIRQCAIDRFAPEVVARRFSEGVTALLQGGRG
jgi:glycosyltransferase involved in cell wall biosynthesis